MQAVLSQLETMARKLGPGAKLPTVVELRACLSVSLGTLDAALRAAEENGLIQRRHGSGIWVSPRLQSSVCLICAPSFLATAGTSPFWQMLVEHTRRRAEQDERAFAFHFAAEEPGVLEATPSNSEPTGLHRGLADDIRSGAVSGAIAVGLADDTTGWIEAHRVPVVSFAGSGSVTAAIDSDEVVRQGVRALAEAGCRRIGLWGPVAPHRAAGPVDHARAVWRSALAERGLESDESWVRLNSHLLDNPRRLTSISQQEQGLMTAQEVFGSDAHGSGDHSHLPDGLVITDDMMTRGALTGLRKAGVNVGLREGDLRIATHSNRDSPVLLGREADLWRLELDPGELANAIFSALERLMRGEDVSSQICIGPRLLQPAAP
jgi:DNA-binding LacI/PurR family transcriptional regulator/DNA-binding transcriptional regulator YhcF (GntR family)